MDPTREFEVAKAAVIEAGRLILEVYSRPFKVAYKSDQSPLTDADRKANEAISRTLRDAFPAHAFLTEEGRDDPTRRTHDWCWIVDPLDGTKEFVKRNGEFTVNIALAHKHRAVLGVIGVPVTGELYYAAQGVGAFRESVGGHGDGRSARAERLTVSSRHHRDGHGLRLAMSRSHDAGGACDRLLAQNDIAEVKQVGSSLKGCLVAAGEAEAYYRFGPTMEWDTAAMQCIVEQAGGLVRQLDGTELLYNRSDSRNDKGFYMVNHPDNRLAGVDAGVDVAAGCDGVSDAAGTDVDVAGAGTGADVAGAAAPPRSKTRMKGV